MARKKVKLAFIENNSQRKATFNKRKRGIIKKITELTTLCDVKACAIIYGPNDENPEVWPSDEDARKLAIEFKELPEIDQSKKMMDHEAYLRQRISKTDDQMKKLKKDSKDLEMTEILSQSFKGNMMMRNLNILDLNDFGYKIDQYFKNVMRNIEIRHESGLEIGESSNAVAASERTASTMVLASTTAPTAPVAPMAPSYEVGGSSSSFAAFYRPNQQQPQFQYHPFAPSHEVGGSSSSYATFYHPSQQQPQFQYLPLASHVVQPQNLNLSLTHNQNQNEWLMEMIMNHHAQLSNVAEQPQPHQPTTGDSTVSAAPSPSNDVPPTNPNPTNNI